MKSWLKSHFAYLPSRNSFIIIATDIALITLAYIGAFLLRLNFDLSDPSVIASIKQTILVVILIKMFLFYFFNLYRGMWRYTGIVDLINLIKAATVSALAITFAIFQMRVFSPRSIVIIDWCLTIILVGGLRLFIRWYYWQSAKNGEREHSSIWAQLFSGIRRDPKAKKLLIVGAGDAGERLLRGLRANSKMNYQPVGFLDDDPKKANRLMHGVPVLGDTTILTEIALRYNIDEVLIAIPFATHKKMRQIVEDCKKAGVDFKIVPTLTEIIDGKISINSVREVAYRDLLGREPVKLDEKRIVETLVGKNILVTGAAGSIGSELCRQIAKFNPNKLILYERAESPLYDLEMELTHHFPDLNIIPVLGDIQNTEELFNTFSTHHPHVIFHAAAYKHVPMMERHPWEAVKNNIGGTRNLLQITERFRAERFVLVSTDKAVNPTSVMGATKKVAEQLVQLYASRYNIRTKFMVVRFGNVLGSVGSVVPLFRKQIKRGGPVTVTHPEITRYFMSIPEACQLILQAGAMGNGGEIFVLNMGKPIKILDIAEDVIRLSGFEPYKDIDIEFIGLRPGEKLHEELVGEDEEVVVSEHEKIFVIKGNGKELNTLENKVEQILAVCNLQDRKAIKEHLKNLTFNTYKPDMSLELEYLSQKEVNVSIAN